MSPRARRTGYQWFCVLLAAVDTGWAVYLLATPRENFDRSPIWSAALQVVYRHDPQSIGYAFAVLALVSWVGFAIGRSLARIAFILAATVWALLAVSFIWAAATEGGLGAGGAITAVAFTLFHLGAVAYYPPDYR